MKNLEDYIIAIPDYPKPGILFRDITGILGNAEGFKLAIDQLCDALKGVEFDAVAALEARGFFFAAPVAYSLGKRFVPIRKPGKLPRGVVRRSYTLEYGVGSIEMHRDAVDKGEKVVVIDDLLATGGTAYAACALIEELGAKVAKVLFVMELKGLKGRDALAGYDIASLIACEEN